MVLIASFDRIVEISLHVSTITGSEEKAERVLCHAGQDITETIDNCIKKRHDGYLIAQKGMSYQHINGNSIFVSGFCAWTMQGGKQNAEKMDNGYIEHLVQDVCMV